MAGERSLRRAVSEDVFGFGRSGRSCRKRRERTLGEAGRHVFGYDNQDRTNSSTPTILAKPTSRPKLCWMLVGLFLMVTGTICVALTLVWIQTASKETEAVTRVHTKAYFRYESVSENAIAKLLQDLVVQDMDVERLAVAEYINMPYLAVEMLSGAMSEGIVTLEGVGNNFRQLWWLQTQLPKLEKAFAWGGIPKLEDVYYADFRGMYAAYSNECVDASSNTCRRFGNTGWSYGFHFRPIDNETQLLCRGMCPGHTKQGFASFYTVDTKSGKPDILVSRQPFDPRQRIWYTRAEESLGALAWTHLHEFPQRRQGKTVYGFSVAAAHYEAGRASMVVGSSLSLAHITDILMRRVTLAAQHRAPDSRSCIFIIDHAGLMIASSTGLSDVICATDVNNRCEQNHQLSWNHTGVALIEESVQGIIHRFGSIDNASDNDVHIDVKKGYIYSHSKLESGHNDFGLRWLIMRAQPIDAYKGEITTEKALSARMTEAALNNLQEDLDRREKITLGLCGCFLAVGVVALSCVSWLVSRHLRTIATEMNKVAKLDFSNADGDLQESSSNLGDVEEARDSQGRQQRWSIIREIAEISHSFDNMKNGLRSFARYMDPYIVQVLVQSGQQAQLGVAKAKVTVFFSDIANFTSMAEVLEPSVLANLLGEYLEEMSRIVMDHRGIVGEFIGDEIMAWWNTPWDLGSRHAAMAFSAAMEQQHRLGSLRQTWINRGLPVVKVRMGIVCGSVLAGNIGSRSRMKYGLVGDNVNVASRLEQLCKRYGVGILTDGKTCDEEGIRESFFIRPIDLVTVKGRSGPTEIYELVACKAQVQGTSLLDMYKGFCENFARIQEMYRSKDFKGAVAAIEAYRQTWPQDVSSQILLERCKQFVEDPPGSDWTAVQHLQEK